MRMVPGEWRPKGAWGPCFALSFNAFVWGVSWWPFRWLQERGLHPLWATALIYALAVVVITLTRPQPARSTAKVAKLPTSVVRNRGMTSIPAT